MLILEDQCKKDVRLRLIARRGGVYARFVINMVDSWQLMLSLALNLVKFLASLKKKTQAKIKKGAQACCTMHWMTEWLGQTFTF